MIGSGGARGGSKDFGASRGEAFGWRRKLGVLDRRTVPAHVDGVHHRQGAAYAKDEAEEDADEKAGEEVHNLFNGMLWATQRRIICDVG